MPRARAGRSRPAPARARRPSRRPASRRRARRGRAHPAGDVAAQLRALHERARSLAPARASGAAAVARTGGRAAAGRCSPFARPAQSAAPSATPASYGTGATRSSSMPVVRESRPFNVQFEATPPVKRDSAAPDLRRPGRAELEQRPPRAPPATDAAKSAYTMISRPSPAAKRIDAPAYPRRSSSCCSNCICVPSASSNGPNPKQARVANLDRHAEPRPAVAGQAHQLARLVAAEPGPPGGGLVEVPERTARCRTSAAA